MPTNQIMDYLKKHGEQLDAQLADATGITLSCARKYLSELTEMGEVITCHSIRFENGKKIEGIKYRASGYVPPAVPGRKAKAQQPES